MKEELMKTVVFCADIVKSHCCSRLVFQYVCCVHFLFVYFMTDGQIKMFMELSVALPNTVTASHIVFLI
jgi:hypothetical protein